MSKPLTIHEPSSNDNPMAWWFLDLWRYRCVGLLLVLLQLSGCGGSGNQVVESDLARETLQQVLQHWQSGGQVDDCQAWVPPVVVGASQWSENAKLLEFRIVEERPLDANLFVNVELTLEIAGRRETVVEQYCVGTDPVLTVFRSMSPAF
ncbi:MAG: hypothetical protein Q8M16_21450 [Pirellulaceae bacterium]|nr:hypothetical protein [Pirellulaceae bacterium]